MRFISLLSDLNTDTHLRRRRLAFDTLPPFGLNHIYNININCEMLSNMRLYYARFYQLCAKYYLNLSTYHYLTFGQIRIESKISIQSLNFGSTVSTHVLLLSICVCHRLHCLGKKFKKHEFAAWNIVREAQHSQLWSEAHSAEWTRFIPL